MSSQPTLPRITSTFTHFIIAQWQKPARCCVSNAEGLADWSSKRFQVTVTAEHIFFPFPLLFHFYCQPKCSDQPMRTVVLCPRQCSAPSRLVARLHCNHTASKWKDGREGHIRLILECMLHWTDHPF